MSTAAPAASSSSAMATGTAIPDPATTRAASEASVIVTVAEATLTVGAGVPLGRIGAASDIAGATLYLCSKAGAYVTGAIIPIDGGESVHHGMTLFREMR